MTRRDRQPIRCAVVECVHVGYWQPSQGRCPTHYRELIERTRAAVARLQAATQTPVGPAHRNPPKEG